jgi:tetratricopeptide (TPR) repeat protein
VRLSKAKNKNWQSVVGGQWSELSTVYRLLPSLLFSFLLVLQFACRSRDAILTQAQASWDNKDYAAATLSYEEFLKDSQPSDQTAEIHFKAANIYYLNLKQYDHAAEHYIRLIEDYPKFLSIEPCYQRLAECYAETKKIREAISEYEKLLIAFPDTENKRKIRMAIADLYYENDKSQALVEYQKIVKDVAYDALAEKAYLKIGGVRILRNEFEPAQSAFQIVIENTTDPMIRRQSRDRMADCLENTSKHEEAIQILEQTEADPKDPNYLKTRIAGIRERQKARAGSAKSQQ